ncbi:GNAT family N-acetyltransferase [Sporosarcina sp. ITBMC105]
MMNSSSDFKGENFDFKSLVWDTNYFGIESAKLSLNGIINDSSKIKLNELMKEFNFITIANFNNLNENNIWLGTLKDVFIADINIQFDKKINQKPIEVHPNTEIYNFYNENVKVKKIAEKSFEYSRFTNDPHLPQEKARKIYLHWTNSAFENENKYFIVTKREMEIAGYLLFSVIKDTAIIELIAVDEKFRGSQVGKSLMFKLEEYVFRNKISNIHVGTQMNNITAVNFYSKLGYKYKSCTSVYHKWNKR